MTPPIGALRLGATPPTTNDHEARPTPAARPPTNRHARDRADGGAEVQQPDLRRVLDRVTGFGALAAAASGAAPTAG